MINLLYCGNQTAYDGMMISLLSIARNTKEPLSIYILTMDLHHIDSRYQPISRIKADYLEMVLQDKNPDSKIQLIDATEIFMREMGKSRNLFTRYTPYSLLRLVADLLPLPDKILYLDTDTIANGDIAPLFHTEIHGYEMAGVKDFLGQFFISPHYMNSGVLLLNLNNIRMSGLFAKSRALCNQKKMAFADQTALNRFNRKKYFLPRRYNEQHRLQKDTVIQHFSKTIRFWPFYHTVNVKPWQIEQVHNVYHIHRYDEVLYEYVAHRDHLRLKGIH